MRVICGWKVVVEAFMASIGSNVLINLDALRKLMENWVCAKNKLVVVMPLLSNRLLNAEMDASVVRLRLAV